MCITNWMVLAAAEAAAEPRSLLCARRQRGSCSTSRHRADGRVLLLRSYGSSFLWSGATVATQMGQQTVGEQMPRVGVEILNHGIKRLQHHGRRFRCVQHLCVPSTVLYRLRSWQRCQAHACGMHDTHASHNIKSRSAGPCLQERHVQEPLPSLTWAPLKSTVYRAQSQTLKLTSSRVCPHQQTAGVATPAHRVVAAELRVTVGHASAIRRAVGTCPLEGASHRNTTQASPSGWTLQPRRPHAACCCLERKAAERSHGDRAEADSAPPPAVPSLSATRMAERNPVALQRGMIPRLHAAASRCGGLMLCCAAGCVSL